MSYVVVADDAFPRSFYRRISWNRVPKISFNVSSIPGLEGRAKMLSVLCLASFEYSSLRLPLHAVFFTIFYGQWQWKHTYHKPLLKVEMKVVMWLVVNGGLKRFRHILWIFLRQMLEMYIRTLRVLEMNLKNISWVKDRYHGNINMCTPAKILKRNNEHFWILMFRRNLFWGKDRLKSSLSFYFFHKKIYCKLVICGG